ncbi:MAG: ABC transporter permease [Ilumatobacter sp.]|nr:MAG: ABC transporter permease [Ilumatobacter sp.]
MRYVSQRLLQFFVVFIVVTFIVMVATRIGSADPVRDLAGGAVSDQQIARVLNDYPYLDQSLFLQYPQWLLDFVTGNLGYSYTQSQSGLAMFQQRLPPTLFMGFWAIVIGLAIAVPVGVYSAYKRDGAFDRGASYTSFAFISMPPLVIAVALLFLVVTRTSLFPTVGGSSYIAPWDSPWGHFRNFFIPSLALGLGLAAVWSRFLRADMNLTLQSDFIMLAKAKGVSPARVLWRHALRSSVLSLITSVALQVSALIGGAVVVEQFFGPRGIGDRLVFAIQQNDILIIQAITAVLVVGVVLANLIVDLLYAVVDPRIRHARKLG